MGEHSEAIHKSTGESNAEVNKPRLCPDNRVLYTRSLFYDSGSGWREYALPSAWYSPYEQLDIAMVPGPDTYSVFTSGRFDTIARIDVPNEGLSDAPASRALYLPMLLR